MFGRMNRGLACLSVRFLFADDKAIRSGSVPGGRCRDLRAVKLYAPAVSI